MKTRQDLPKVYNIDEMTVVTGLSVATLRKKIALREIPFYKIGGRIVFKADEISEWIEGFKVATHSQTA